MSVVRLEKVYSTIHFPHWTTVTLLLPTLGFILCVLISITFHFDQVTATHCNVWNFLPTISAAVGQSTPEKYIWRFCIAYHCMPRTVLHTSVYWNQYQDWAAEIDSPLYKWAIRATSLLHVIENLSLVTLTFVSSSENYPIHARSFGTFMTSATLHMLLTIYVQRKAKQMLGFNEAQQRAYRVKVFACLTNISVFLFSMYLFMRHNEHCEPGGKLKKS